MTYLSTDGLSKQYGEKILFRSLTFGLSKGDKTALIAPNGTGKSTLLKILAGLEPPDEGKVMLKSGVRIGYLAQEPDLDPELTIQQVVQQGQSETVRIIQQYDKAVEAQALDYNEQTQAAFDRAVAAMDQAEAWDYEQRLTQILGKLNIHRLDQRISTLSGGERKRVALAFALLNHPDVLILDEPTNHLDLEMIEWLEQFLTQSTMTLLMVTHDRYFLDRICTHILEMHRGRLYHHKGNYGYYLEKKAEREAALDIAYGKSVQLLKQELEWMRRGPKARTTKAKARIDAYYELEDRVASGKKNEQELQLDVKMSRMGSKILELKKACKRYGDLVILDNFEYSFSKGERIGIVGKNGVGKSTFLKILMGEEPLDSGEVLAGDTLVFGHFSQKGLEPERDKRVIEMVKEVAEVIPLANGKQLTASQFLEYFLFPGELQYTFFSKLSGGEKRRLGLMMTLIKNPNFLILDEPTNDLDLDTMNKLEEFLLNFGGCLLLVTHDRFFMDKLVDQFFAFEGNGVVTRHHTSYEEYRELKKKEEQQRKNTDKPKARPTPVNAPRKLSFAEQKEVQKLVKDIEKLEAEKASIEAAMAAGRLSGKDLESASIRYGNVIAELDEKTLRWIELEE